MEFALVPDDSGRPSYNSEEHHEETGSKVHKLSFLGWFGNREV